MCFGNQLKLIFDRTPSLAMLFTGITLDYNSTQKNEPFECLTDQSSFFEPSNAKINKSFSLTEICKNVTFVQPFINIKQSLVQATHTCSLLGGRLLMFKEFKKLYTGLVPLFNNSLLSTSKIYETSSTMSWCYGEKIISEMNIEGTEYYKVFHLRDQDYRFLKPFYGLYINFCIAPRYKRVNLYGPLRQFMQEYLMLSLNSDIKLFSKYGDISRLERRDKEWILSSEAHNEKVFLKNAILPFGRKFWSFQNQTQLLTFTVCSLDEFTCSDGNCLPNSVRCNNTFECKDESDEEQCSPIVKQASYQVHVVPPPRENESMFTIDVDGWVKKIGNIAPNDDKLMLEVKIQYEWYDPRLVFWNPLINQTLNCSEIWSPEIKMLDNKISGFQVEYKSLLSECRLLTTRANKSELKRSYTSPYMGKHLLSTLR